MLIAALDCPIVLRTLRKPRRKFFVDVDHILFIGFGAPEKMEDVKPFLQKVTAGLNIPEERLREVLHHYEKIGGGSPYNACVLRLCREIQKRISPPCFAGMRNWHPFMKDTLLEI